MGVQHACSLCDYTRDAEYPTVLDPACPRCGGLLRPAGPSVPAAPTRLASLARERWVERALLAIVLLPLLLAAVKVGWGAAGPAAGVGALVVSMLCAYVALTPTTRHR